MRKAPVQSTQKTKKISLVFVEKSLSIKKNVVYAVNMCCNLIMFFSLTMLNSDCCLPIGYINLKIY
mgnify:CR=1 FL=1